MGTEIRLQVEGHKGSDKGLSWFLPNVWLCGESFKGAGEREKFAAKTEEMRARSGATRKTLPRGPG